MSDDIVVAAAAAIIAAATVKKRRRRSCWVHDWMSRRPQYYGTHAALLPEIHVSDPKTYKNFCRMDTN